MDFPAGWTCELVVARLDAYLLETMALADALAVAEHLEACPGCGERRVVRRTIVVVRDGVAGG